MPMAPHTCRTMPAVVRWTMSGQYEGLPTFPVKSWTFEFQEPEGIRAESLRLAEQWGPYVVTRIAFQENVSGQLLSWEIDPESRVRVTAPADAESDLLRARFIEFAQRLSDASLERLDTAADQLLASSRPIGYAEQNGIWVPVILMHEVLLPGNVSATTLSERLWSDAVPEAPGAPEYRVEAGAWTWELAWPLKVYSSSGRKLAVDPLDRASLTLENAPLDEEIQRGIARQVLSELGIDAPVLDRWSSGGGALLCG